MTDLLTIYAAKEHEALAWARRGFALTFYDGPVPMTEAQRAAFVATGRPPARRDTTAAERAAMSRGEL